MADDATKQSIETYPKRSYSEMAKERNARVILCHTPDTYMLTDLTRVIDRAIRNLRDKAFTILPLSTVQPLFEAYSKNIVDLYETVIKICETANVRYKPSRSLAKWLEAQGIETPEAHEETAIQKAKK